MPCHKYSAPALRHGISADTARRRKPPKQSSHNPCHRHNARIRGTAVFGLLRPRCARARNDGEGALGLAMTGKDARACNDEGGTRGLAMTGADAPVYPGSAL